MPSNAIGYSFAPTFENAAQAKSTPGGTPQGAIQTLNFRLPRVTGAASAHALSPLVGQERVGANFGGAVLESVLRTVLGAEQASAILSGSPAASAPATPANPISQPGRDTGSHILEVLSRGGGGTDTYSGWAQQERDLNRRDDRRNEIDDSARSARPDRPSISAPSPVSRQAPSHDETPTLSRPGPPVIHPGDEERPDSGGGVEEPDYSAPPFDRRPGGGRGALSFYD